MSGRLEHREGHVHYQNYTSDGVFPSYLTCFWWWACHNKWFWWIEMEIFDFSLTKRVRIYTLWCKQIKIIQNDYFSSLFSFWWISILSKVNLSKNPLDMPGGKTKAISLRIKVSRSTNYLCNLVHIIMKRTLKLVEDIPIITHKSTSVARMFLVMDITFSRL